MSAPAVTLSASERIVIHKPGIYDMTAEDYHADPAPVPSLSSSIAKELLSSSPLHAWHSHPRLNPNHRPEVSDKFDLGAAAHALILEGRNGVEIIEAEDYKTKAARDLRDQARRAGKVPLLSAKWDEVQEMAAAVRRQCDAHEDAPIPLANGKPEQAIFWQEDNGVWCRALLDWSHEAGDVIDDLKTTKASAHPDHWQRTMYGMDADLQAAFYLRGWKKLTGIDASFRFVVAENYPPFGVSVISLTPAAIALAERQVTAAIALWGECLQANDWPCYPFRTCYIDAPAYVEAQRMERELREVPTRGLLRDDGPDVRMEGLVSRVREVHAAATGGGR